MQLIKLSQDGTPISVMTISGLSEQEILSRYPDYIINGFQFEQPTQCYTYDAQTQSFALRPDWESLLPEVIEPEVVPPKISPIAYKMLWTIQERIGLKTLRATDVVIDDLYELVEDSRMTTVDLNLQSVQDSIMYCLNALVTVGVIQQADVQTRYEQILTGNPL